METLSPLKRRPIVPKRAPKAEIASKGAPIALTLTRPMMSPINKASKPTPRAIRPTNWKLKVIFFPFFAIKNPRFVA